MQRLRQIILAVGIMALAGSFAACGGASKNAAEPAQPAAAQPAEELGAPGEPGAPAEPGAEDGAPEGEVEPQLAPGGDGTDPCSGGW